MTTEVDKSVVVNVPVSVAYNQWTQFEEFPQFMGGVQQVTQLGDDNLHWVAQIGGVKREWNAKVLEQVPDQKVSWAATEGATNAGAVYFQSLGADSTSVRLHLEYEPEGIVEKAGDALSIVEKQAESDLEKFKSFIESRGTETGGWRGTVDGPGGTPGVEHAADSQGDSGTSGISTTAVVAGVAAAAAGVAAAAALRGRSDDKDTEVEAPTVTTETLPVDVVTTDVGTDTPAYGVGDVDTTTTDLTGTDVPDVPGTTGTGTVR